MKLRLPFSGETSLRRQILKIFNIGLIFFTAVLLLLIDQNIKNAAIAKTSEAQSKQATFFSTLIDTDVSESLSAISSRSANMHNLHLNDRDIELSLNSLQKSLPKFSWIG